MKIIENYQNLLKISKNLLKISKNCYHSQVFRTAIDSSYLALLQEWLICSLSNFLTYPNQRKSIWFLTIIFMSSTLNLHLLKLFPLILDEDISVAQLYTLFLVSAKDFYDRLSEKQRNAFRECFRNKFSSPTSPTSLVSNEDLFQNLLKHL